jgi:hypothetical protein
MLKRVFLLLIPVVMIVILSKANNIGTIISGQQPTLAPVVPAPIYTGERIAINTTLWSPDSQSLRFEGVDNGVVSYGQYYLKTPNLWLSERNPLTIVLTGQQQHQLKAQSDIGYVSPNGEYIIYAHQEEICGESGCEPQWALGDLQTGQHALLTMGMSTRRRIVWSDDSSAALILIDGHYGGLGGAYYVSDFGDDVGQVQTIQLMNFFIGTHTYVDISADGERVLLREQFDGLETGLYVWDSTGPLEPRQFVAGDSPIVFEDEVVTGAAFLADNESIIIAVTDDGIVRLNLATDEQDLTNAVINAEWVEWAYFSPDARFIAVLPRVSVGFSCQLFVLPVDFAGNIGQMLDEAARCPSYG